MRRNHLAGILLLSVFSWIVILYLFLLDKPYGKLQLLSPEDSSNQLKELENKIQDEIKSNLDFMDQVKKVIELQSAEEGIKETAEGENEENNTQDYIEKRLVELSSKEGVMAVLVFSCNRVTVKRCLDQLLRYRPNPEHFPILVSQDCGHEPTANVIRTYKDQVFHIIQPDLSEILVPPKEKKFRGYFKIARHYGWALNQVFYHYNFTNVIVIEDDLDISPDLFSYFLATLPLLQTDPTLWCVSAWNDNGKVDLIDASRPDLLHRTDFFPGLGWMLTRNIWDELSPKWPQSYWDDWIRQPEQRKNRSCIRPEVSRTRTFGKIGVSNGLFYEKHLKYIHLNDKAVDFSVHNLTYLLKDNYDEAFVRIVYNSPVVSHLEVKSGSIVHQGSVRIPFHSKLTFRAATKSLGLMDDFRSGVPRTGYRGVVSFFYKGRRVYLAPTQRWKGYDTTWS